MIASTPSFERLSKESRPVERTVSPRAKLMISASFAWFRTVSTTAAATPATALPALPAIRWFWIRCATPHAAKRSSIQFDALKPTMYHG